MKFKYLSSLVTFAMAMSTNVVKAADAENHLGAIVGTVNSSKASVTFSGLEYQRNLTKDFAIGIGYERLGTLDPSDKKEIVAFSGFWYPIKYLKIGLGVGKEKVSGKHNHSDKLSRFTLSYEHPVDSISIAPTLTIDRIKGHNYIATGIAFSIGF